MSLVTPQSIFFIQRLKEQRRSGLFIKKRIPLTQIENITMSTLPDNWLCLKLFEDIDILFENEHKTELVTILDDIYFKEFGYHLKLVFANQFEFEYSKRKNKNVEFITDSTISSVFKNTISVTKTYNFQITVMNDLPAGTLPYSKANQSSNIGRKSMGLTLNTLETCPKLKSVEYGQVSETCKEIIRPVNVLEDKSVVRLLVLYDYHPVLEDELNIRDGDVITLLKTNDDGWGYGRLETVDPLDGRKVREGYFPLNYTMSEEQFSQYYSNPEVIH